MDAYDMFLRNERAAEREHDNNRQGAPYHDGIMPANIPVWLSLRQENNDGSTDLNCSINRVLTELRSLQGEHEELVALRQRTQILELALEEATVELEAMTARRDLLADIVGRCATTRWSNPAEPGVRRLLEDISRAA